MLVGLKKYGGNTSVKRPAFVVGLVLGTLSFVHTPVLSCPYTRTKLGLRLRFARNKIFQRSSTADPGECVQVRRI